MRDVERPMTWEAVCADPLLQDLPFKIELDNNGRILMSPAANRHGRLQMRIGLLLETMLGGEAAVEIALYTAAGVRVPDVVWMSDAYRAAISDSDAVYAVAPEICVEIQSPSNPWSEMHDKVTLYLARGAQEVWVCDPDGAMHHFGHEGERERSRLAPDFPDRIRL